MTKTRLAAFALLGVGFAWGAAFVLMKDAIAQQPYLDFLAIRFSIAAMVMIAIRPKVALNFQAGDIKYGLAIGVVLAFGFITQTIGLDLTTASTSGFLTGLYVILTPILAWLWLKKKINLRVGIGAILALIGIGVLSGAANDVEFQTGQLWLIGCAFLYAIHILLLGKHGKGRNSYRFTMLQLMAVAIICWGFALADGYQGPPNSGVWFAVLFTAIFSSVLAFWVQTWAQGFLDPARVALLITSEVVFSAVIAVVVGQEVATWAMLIGGSLLLTAMLIVEWPNKKNQILLEPKLHE
jgi:drug/metabolite transporter (DMT)-like permease